MSLALGHVRGLEQLDELLERTDEHVYMIGHLHEAVKGQFDALWLFVWTLAGPATGCNASACMFVS